MRYSSTLVACLVILLGIATACSPSEDVKKEEPSILAAIPKDFWGMWARVGSATEYYVSDSFIERIVPNGPAEPDRTRYAFSEAERNPDGGTYATFGTQVVMGKQNNLFLIADADADSAPFYVVLKAPANKIEARAMFQGSVRARSLAPAASVSLVIQNVLHSQSQTISSAADGSFAIPDAVAGDSYKVTALIGGIVRSLHDPRLHAQHALERWRYRRDTGIIRRRRGFQGDARI